MKESIRLRFKRHSFQCGDGARYMAKLPSKQITIRFDLSDWVRILEAAEQAGIKPVQFVRSTVLRTLNGHLVDAKSIDAYLKQQEKEEFHKRRGH